MIDEQFPKVLPPSRQSLKNYNPKFVIDKCARKKYGATLSVIVVAGPLPICGILSSTVAL